MAALFLIVALAAAPARADAASARELIAQAAAADAAGDVEKGWKLAEKAARLAPEDRDARAAAASAALASGRYREAVEQASAALEKGEPTPALLQTRSAAYQGLARPTDALADAQAALTLNPASAAGRLRLAQASEAAGNPGAALQNYRRAAMLDGALLPVYQQAQRRLGGADPWRPWAAGGAGLLVFGAIAFVSLRKNGRSRRVRFGSVIYVPPAADEPAPGKVVAGRYIVGRALDRSGGVHVYEGRDLDDRPLLIRRYLPTLEPRRRFRLASAQAAVQLKHAGLSPLEAAFEEGSWSLAVAAAPAGKTLAEALDKASGRRLPVSEIVAGAKGLAEGLDAAHAAGLRHGHVGPQEIRVEDGGWRLAGLGLPGSSPADHVPPEGEADTPEADVYALACCLYEALSGEKPFSGAEAALAKTEGRPASLAGRVGLPAGLDAFFARALQPDPARRFRSATEMVLALRNLAQPAVH